MQGKEQQQHVEQLVREILGQKGLDLQVCQVLFEEDVQTLSCSIRATLEEKPSGNRITVEGRGVGIVDAFFQAMLSRFSPEYPSLRTIAFSRFAIDGRMNSRRERQGTDAEVEVTLVVANSEGREFEFSHRSRSLTASAVCTVLAAISYFVGSEKAFVAAWKYLEDAKERSRDDLVQRYTGHLVELVKNTSYSEMIESIRKKLR